MARGWKMARLKPWGRGYFKRLWRFFGSMKLAVALIIAILLGLLLSAVFPQIPTFYFPPQMY